MESRRRYQASSISGTKWTPKLGALVQEFPEKKWKVNQREMEQSTQPNDYQVTMVGGGGLDPLSQQKDLPESIEQYLSCPV